jgi:hypothetical protein
VAGDFVYLNQDTFNNTVVAEGQETTVKESDGVQSQGDNLFLIFKENSKFMLD